MVVKLNKAHLFTWQIKPSLILAYTLFSFPFSRLTQHHNIGNINCVFLYLNVNTFSRRTWQRLTMNAVKFSTQELGLAYQQLRCKVMVLVADICTQLQKEKQAAVGGTTSYVQFYGLNYTLCNFLCGQPSCFVNGHAFFCITFARLK